MREKVGGLPATSRGPEEILAGQTPACVSESVALPKPDFSLPSIEKNEAAGNRQTYFDKFGARFCADGDERSGFGGKQYMRCRIYGMPCAGIWGAAAVK